jgi:hypothetical protein
LTQIAEQHLIRATIAIKTMCVLLEKLSGNQIHPVKRPGAQVF